MERRQRNGQRGCGRDARVGMDLKVFTLVTRGIELALWGRGHSKHSLEHCRERVWWAVGGAEAVRSALKSRSAGAEPVQLEPWV